MCAVEVDADTFRAFWHHVQQVERDSVDGRGYRSQADKRAGSRLWQIAHAFNSAYRVNLASVEVVDRDGVPHLKLDLPGDGHIVGLGSHERLAEEALRGIQKFDEAAGAVTSPRFMLMQAASALGELLGLECTGVDQGGGFFDHSGDTCPIHEWLRPEEDYEVAQSLRADNP